MVKDSVNLCAKKLVSWAVIKEYSVSLMTVCLVFAFIAIVVLALGATNTPKGQYNSEESAFWTWMFVISIVIILFTIGIFIVINMRYKTWKRIALAEPSFTEAIVDTLTSRSWELNSIKHKAVIVLLGDMGSKRATPFLISALQCNDSNIQEKSMDAIGKIGDTIAIEPLIAVLEGILSNSRIKAAETLDKLEWTPRNSTEEAHYLFAKLDWRKLVSLGGAAVEVLIKALRNNSVEIRMRATSALEEIASAEGHVGEEAVEALIQALDDQSNSVGLHAARALGIIRAERAIEPLRKASKFYKDSTVATEAKQALKRILEKQGIDN